MLPYPSLQDMISRLNEFVQKIRTSSDPAPKAKAKAKANAEAEETQKTQQLAHAAKIEAKMAKEPKWDTLEEALTAALACRKCYGRDDGTKGCRTCMGEWFETIRKRRYGARTV